MQISRKKLTTIAIIILFLGTIVAAFIVKNIDKPTKSIYEVAVMVQSQNNSDSEEDRKTSLKKGDVLTIQKGDHNWSKTESVSYLILKMNLTKEQAQKLTQPKTRELAYEELSEAEKSMVDEEKKRAKSEGREYVPEPREETLIAREYYIDLNKLEDFKPSDLILKQPFEGRVFDWSIVEKKE